MVEACTCAKCLEIYKQGCADDECGIETQSAWSKRMAHARELHAKRVKALERVAEAAQCFREASIFSDDPDDGDCACHMKDGKLKECCGHLELRLALEALETPGETTPRGSE